jgi:hypothetical protein
LHFAGRHLLWSARLEMAQRRAIEKGASPDWAGRNAAEIMPLTFRSA